MNVRKFMRQNLMIVVSIVLPLLVVIAFALASLLPNLFSAPPAHDLLISVQGRTTAKSSPLTVKFAVRGETIKAIVVKADTPAYTAQPRLFRYSHLSGETVEVPFPLPENFAALEEGAEIDIPGLQDTRVQDTLRAPDGYEFRGRRSGGGLMTDIFGGSRNRTDVSIEKNGAVRRIRLPAADYWYNDVRMIGWIIG